MCTCVDLLSTYCFPSFRLLHQCTTLTAGHITDLPAYLQCITLDHKKYEQAIQDAVASAKRSSQLLRDRKCLKISGSSGPAGGDAGPSRSHMGRGEERLPKQYKEVAPRQRTATGQPQQDHGPQDSSQPIYYVPSVSSAPGTCYLEKRYDVTASVLRSVFEGLDEAQVWPMGFSVDSAWEDMAEISWQKVPGKIWQKYHIWQKDAGEARLMFSMCHPLLHPYCQVLYSLSFEYNGTCTG